MTSADSHADSTAPIIHSSSRLAGMIHSEDELEHALRHLLPKDGLEGHESLTVYRNARRKYSKAFGESEMKEGIRGIEPFRSVEGGILAAHKAGLCCKGLEREASALYVTVNPRHVPDAMKETHSLYYKWIEHRAGLSKQQVRRGDRADYAGTLPRALLSNILKTKSRVRFLMIDVDDNDPTTWLQKTRDAIGDDAIEMIIKTKNGFHLLYRPKDMTQESHKRLDAVLRSDTGKGPDENVTRTKGTSIACALPGGYQSDHPTKILYCSCQRTTGASQEQ